MNDEGGQDDLRQRTKQFALRVVKLYQALPTSGAGAILGKQVLRSGTSVGAHHREAFRSRTTAEFVSKMEVGTQELDETLYWLEILAEAGIVPSDRLHALSDEAEQLLAIFTASVKTAKRRTTR